MDIEIRYFAAAREATRCAGEQVACAEGARVADLVAELVARHPPLADALPSLRYALDESFVEGDATLTPGATLALIPPVGGG